MEKLTNRQIGGLKTAKIIREKHGKDFYSKIGAIGGSKSGGAGFGTTTNPSLAGLKSAAIKKWRKAGKPESEFPTSPRKWKRIAKW